MKDDLERQALLDFWRARLNDAKLRVDFASNYVKEVQRDLETLSPADGDLAMERAIRAQNLALSECNRILRIFTDLVVEGKIPVDEQAPGGAEE